jgi:hypothetical protein
MPDDASSEEEEDTAPEKTCSCMGMGNGGRKGMDPWSLHDSRTRIDLVRVRKNLEITKKIVRSWRFASVISFALSLFCHSTMTNERPDTVSGRTAFD